MGKKKKDIKEKIIQRSIGFNFRQIEFFNDYPEFKPDIFCRKIIDEQIEQIDKKYLSKEDQEKWEKEES